MTIIKGERLAAVGPKQTITLTRPAAAETSGLTTVLPTTEPGTSQIIWTVAAGDAFVPAPMVAMYVGHLLAGVKNLDSATRTVGWRMIKNGTSVATGITAAMSATTGGTKIDACFQDVAVGDVLELRLWSASSTNVQLAYYAHWTQESRLRLSATQWAAVTDYTLTLCSTAAATHYPALSSWPGGATPSLGTTVQVPAWDINSSLAVTHGSSLTAAVAAVGPTYGFYRNLNGDTQTVNTIQVQVSTFTGMQYVAETVMTSIVLRRVRGVT